MLFVPWLEETLISKVDISIVLCDWCEAKTQDIGQEQQTYNRTTLSDTLSCIQPAEFRESKKYTMQRWYKHSEVTVDVYWKTLGIPVQQKKLETLHLVVTNMIARATKFFVIVQNCLKSIAAKDSPH